MISDLPLFQIYGAMARHAAESQRVSATNMTRADEPGFKAVEVESFQDYLDRVARVGNPDAVEVRTHLSATPAAPNGNTVSVEVEMVKSADAMGQHSLALSVYTKSMDLMRTAIGRSR